MSEITYYAAIENMGDNITASDAAGYREWAESQLSAEFPEAEIEVSKEQNLKSFSCSDDMDEDEVGQFCKSLWDKCTWSWVK